MEKTISNKKYYSWIDFAKVFGLYMVTLGHGTLLTSKYTMIIYSFHMPFFFMLSGMLYNKRSITDTVKKSWHSLIIPYLLINLICLVYYTIYSYRHSDDLLNVSLGRIGAILMGLGYNVENWTPVSTPLWFVAALLYIQYMMAMAKNRMQEIILLLLSFVVTFIILILNIDTYPPIDSAFMAFPFFYFGYILKDYIMLKKIKISIIIFIFFIWLSLVWLNGRSDIAVCQYGNNLFLFYIIGFCGSFSFISIFSRINSFNHLGAVNQLSKGTMIMMGFNVLAVFWAEYLFNKFIPYYQESGFRGIVIGGVVMIFFYPIVKLSSLYFPALLGYRK